VIVTALQPNIAYRLSRTFAKPTRLSIQVRGAFNVVISHDQGSCQNGILGNIPDGLQLNSANTNPPYDFWWQGELWYAATVAGAQFAIEIGTETS